jgi:hypothetical protein
MEVVVSDRVVSTKNTENMVASMEKGVVFDEVVARHVRANFFITDVQGCSLVAAGTVATYALTIIGEARVVDPIIRGVSVYDGACPRIRSAAVEDAVGDGVVVGPVPEMHEAVKIRECQSFNDDVGLAVKQNSEICVSYCDGIIVVVLVSYWVRRRSRFDG